MIYATGIEETIKRLEERKKTDEKLREVMEKLAQIGVGVAKFSFANAIYDGENDTQVSLVWEGENCVVQAAGRHVLFIEFGSGTHYQEHPLAAEFGFFHGVYGRGRGYEPKYPKGWVYVGPMGSNPTGYAHHPAKTLKGGKKLPPDPTKVRTLGNPPSMSMYVAGREMRNNVERIVKEVFK